ncbi:hypothetical protein [Yersinia hibernica]|uniref:Uncharacterized protein n=1 Tax=Yersinia enterocolitica LC20 TaxID=1443113 RepID=A0A7U4GHC4_YEREN|nr:hypothetical protein [Yersinia hibernica]AHM75328.1 hypothetical protein LC20_04075 [Yersinia hibernica]
MIGFTTAISSDRPPVLQSTWRNSPEALLKNHAIHELIFHYNNGSENKKAEIEKSAINHTINICSNLNYVANDNMQNKSVNTATKLVEFFSGQNDIRNKIELAKKIKTIRQLDFSVLNKEDTNGHLQTLKRYIDVILPEEKIQSKYLTQSENKCAEGKPLTENMQTTAPTRKSIDNTLSCRVKTQREYISSQPDSGENNRNIIARFFPNLIVSLLDINLPHR